MDFNPHLLMQKTCWREESCSFEHTAMFSPPFDIQTYMCFFFVVVVFQCIFFL